METTDISTACSYLIIKQLNQKFSVYHLALVLIPQKPSKQLFCYLLFLLWFNSS
jgi:hypothetical protein